MPAEQAARSVPKGYPDCTEAHGIGRSKDGHSATEQSAPMLMFQRRVTRRTRSFQVLITEHLREERSLCPQTFHITSAKCPGSFLNEKAGVMKG